MAKKTIKYPILPKKIDFTDKKQGFLALLAGLLLVILGGFTLQSMVSPVAWASTVLILGLIVGLINIFHKEALTFLIIGLSSAFMLSVLATATVLPKFATAMFSSSVYFLAAASLAVALKAIYALTQR